MDYLIGAVLAFGAWMICYLVLALAWALVVARTTVRGERSRAYDRGVAAPLLVSIGVACWVFYAFAIA